MQAKDLLPDHVSETERDGVIIRKDTVGAFLVNAKVWSDPAVDPAQRAVAEHDIIEAAPVLRALGLFDVLAIRDTALQHLVERSEESRVGKECVSPCGARWSPV